MRAVEVQGEGFGTMSKEKIGSESPFVPLRSFYDLGDKPESIFSKCLADYASGMEAFFQDCISRCESPIEKLLLAALCSRMRLEFTFFIAHPIMPELGSIKNAVICTPQVDIGPYRADFVLLDLRHNPARRTVIECDGHNFHERTKDQAKRDRSRDRWFAAEGIPVLRFTGSEIYNDPFLVADEIARWIARS